jgi:hypothetical protein
VCSIVGEINLYPTENKDFIEAEMKQGRQVATLLTDFGSGGWI